MNLKHAIPVVAGAVAGAVVALIVAGGGSGGTKTVTTSFPAASSGRSVPTSLSTSSRGLTINQIYRRDSPGVVDITVTSQQQEPGGLFGGGSQQTEGEGAGVVYDTKGDILTDEHVVANATSVEVHFQDGTNAKAKVLGTDPSTDMAVIKVDVPASELHPIPFADSNNAQVGDPVVAIGSPFSLPETTTAGIVSAVGRSIPAPNNYTITGAIQTDAAINPGNSGGPLLDANGRVIGINSQIATGGGSGSVGIGFAVPINLAKKVIPQLKKAGTVQRAYLGVEMTSVTKQVAQSLHLPTDHGALIQRVIPGGPADKAGLRGGHTRTGQGINAGGDLLVKVAGKDVKTSDDVASAIAGKKPGDSVTVQYYRGKQQKKATVTLGKRPNQLPSSSGSGGGGGGDILPLP
jgi:S1-C subfamily serine protease